MNKKAENILFFFSKVQHNIFHILIHFQVLKILLFKISGKFTFISYKLLRDAATTKPLGASHKYTFYPTEIKGETGEHHGHKTTHSRCKFQQTCKLLALMIQS